MRFVCVLVFVLASCLHGNARMLHWLRFDSAMDDLVAFDATPDHTGSNLVCMLLGMFCFGPRSTVKELSGATAEALTCIRTGLYSW